MLMRPKIPKLCLEFLPYLFDKPPWALIKFFCLQDLIEVGANSRLGAYSNKYGITKRKNDEYHGKKRC